MAERCGFNKVGAGVGTGENRSATKKAHKPMPQTNQLHPSIHGAINRVKGGNGKVMGEAAAWPKDYSKVK